MMRNLLRKSVLLKVMLGVLVLLMYAPPSSAIAGVRRRAVRRTAIVVGSTEKSAAEKQEAGCAAADRLQRSNSRRLRPQQLSLRQPRRRLPRHRLRLPVKLRRQTAAHPRSRHSNNWKSCNRFTNRG